MNNPILSINIVVLNGEKYIRRCLESIAAQSYPHDQIEIHILDNGSTDETVNIIEEFIPKFTDFVDIRFTKSSHNLGMWGGHQDLLRTTRGSYLVVLSVDVILEKDFAAQAIQKMEADPSLGALQGKIYQFDISDLSERQEPERKIIDTCGFEISRSRRIGNIGHGERDTRQYEQSREIFGVEGAVPVLRTAAFKSIEVIGEIADHDLFWYAEDLDIAWRIRLAGWKQRYEPSLIAWHDRQTTKQTRRSLANFIAIRRAIPLRKRRLEWRNIRCTIIKNDYIINILKDLPQILARELAMTAYLLIFEPRVLGELPRLLHLLPRMLRKRHEILRKAKVTPEEIHRFFV